MYRDLRLFCHMRKLISFLIMFLSVIFGSAIFADEIRMNCKHSFQGNYNGDVLLKYDRNTEGGLDKAYIRVKDGWLQICTDMETHGAIQINDFVASCSMYLPNWMNGRRKSFIWNFKTKEMHFQILSRVFNSETDTKEWQWRYSIGEVGSKQWKVISGWESAGVIYNKKKCRSQF